MKSFALARGDEVGLHDTLDCGLLIGLSTVLRCWVPVLDDLCTFSSVMRIFCCALKFKLTLKCGSQHWSCL